jgi:CBS domain containing-hemolysin-like protein
MKSLIPLLLFLLGIAGIYVGTVQAAFTALMRLPERLSAERSDPNDLLTRYLDEPRLLFIPARLLLGLILVFSVELTTILFGISTWRSVGTLALMIGGFVVACEHLVPQLIVRTNPRVIAEFLLPSFRIVASPLLPLTLALLGLVRRRDADGTATEELEPRGGNGAGAEDAETPPATNEDEERLLRSIVHFGDTLVREIMTPRPDLVAISAEATIGELRAQFREQRYSRVPVFKDNLDNILGIVFMKDLLVAETAADTDPVTAHMRAAYFAPETKKVPELLREFQRRQIQAAIVVDEYGGTAGLVTIEDMLEEIVGEIRDEYDVESEPIVDEGDGVFVFSAKVDIDAAAERLGVDIERDGFETVGGFVVTHLGRVPAPGERLAIGDVGVEVLEAERRRVHKVRLRRQPAPAEP